ncbi:two component transcriptional regulator, LuxR family [Pseudonocardia ammonioxydans]|uniref:Two component transcriptional regulator, LuxR family n=1 Tax=Pseudonocardia ammonioxydans TaxID=260086 RepID=A0A1I4WJ75_PSUAM|nr:response regulator transcription factor [Pseudonocardia ammonioxydans]SFN13507.1 two component transcriptional regulator, LuxR family [Pseudonocardia ammonioxydans]
MTLEAVREATDRPVRGHDGVDVVRRAARVLVVDAEPIVRHGLRALLTAEPDLAPAGEAASPRDALMVAERTRPDVIVVDIEFGRDERPGLDLVRALLERCRGAKVLVLTGCRDRDSMMRTVRLGVHGYLRKGADTTEIVRAVRAVQRGEGVFDPGTGAAGPLQVLREPAPSAGPDLCKTSLLTDRENQVLRLLAVGLSNREIGTRLRISEATVKFHVRNLRDKLEVRRRTEIVYTAARQGIV